MDAQIAPEAPDAPVSLGNRSFSRRTLVRTAAWSAPVISVMSAAPAFAAYSTPTVLSITSVGLAASNRVKTAGKQWFVWSGTSYISFTETATTLPATIANPALLTTTVSGVKSTGGSGSEIVTLTLTLAPQTTSGTARGHGQYTFDTTNWELSTATPPSIDNATKVVTFTFVSKAALAAGATAPDLVFVTAVGSTSGATSYAITSGSATATATAANATSGVMTGTL